LRQAELAVTPNRQRRARRATGGNLALDDRSETLERARREANRLRSGQA
jgi:hypothetical protein